jgi:hypothetical protein
MSNSGPGVRPPLGSNVPPGWGSDELSKFWDAARANQFGTFVKKRLIYERLVAIDRAFFEVRQQWANPNPLAAMLFVRCHSAFRTAAGLAAAGQAVESYVINRAVLESAAYALHIFRNPDLGTLWLNRHQDDASMAAMREAFSHRKVQTTVTAVNRHAGERFEMLYQRTIDLGGHPNERSVTGNMSMVNEPDRLIMRVNHLVDDGPTFDLALKSTAQCGVCSLEILQGVFHSLFELLGVNSAILGLREGL